MTLTGGDSTGNESTPVSTARFNKLETSVDTRFDELKQLILGIQNSLTTFTPPHPENSTSQDPKDPNDKNLGDEEVGVENVVEDGNESIHTTKPKPINGNGSGKFSAVSGPSYTGAPSLRPHMLMLVILPCLMHLASPIGNF